MTFQLGLNPRPLVLAALCCFLAVLACGAWPHATPFAGTEIPGVRSVESACRLDEGKDKSDLWTGAYHLKLRARHFSQSPEVWPESTAGAAVLALIVLSDTEREVRLPAMRALDEVTGALKAQGTVLAWIVPRVYSRELVGLALLLAAWFFLTSRFPKHRPTSTPKHFVLMAVTAAVPVGASCSAVYYAITREWAQGFLPDAVTLVPFDVAAVLSTALVCALPAVWVCARKKLADEATLDVGEAAESDAAA